MLEVESRPALTAAPSRRRRMRAVGREFGLALIGLGLVLLLFAAFELWGTGVAEARSQHQLKRDTAAGLPPLNSPIPGGRVIGRIEIARIHVDQYFVQGVGVSDLHLGPGHYPATPYPGEAGNAAIAGHRTTYGAPFYNLDKLQPGDPIVTTTHDGRFVYVVRRVFVVRPNQSEVLKPTPDNRLTLTTCNPRYSARQRLIVVAALQGNAAIAHLHPGTAGAVGPSLGGDSRAWPPTIVWGAVLGVIWTFGRIGFRRWGKGVSLAIAIPLGLGVLWPLFENVARLLPANI